MTYLFILLIFAYAVLGFFALRSHVRMKDERDQWKRTAAAQLVNHCLSNGPSMHDGQMVYLVDGPSYELLRWANKGNAPTISGKPALPYRPWRVQ